MKYVAIGLKIPDNAAYTALTALERLGIALERVERNEIHPCGDASGDSDDAIARRFERDESLFNPNKHRLRVLDGDGPRAGELWIRERDAGTTVGWRLFERGGAAASRETLLAAAERLLCNPAIEDALFPENAPER